MLLNSLFFILIFGILGLIVIPSSYKLILRQYSLSVTTIVFILSLFLYGWVLINPHQNFNLLRLVYGYL